ncbi:MAG TPA: hypothetical protein DIW64_18785 [Cellvibrio sp.]|nr:hypothetical protein [Cellvibrio sp.]
MQKYMARFLALFLISSWSQVLLGESIVSKYLTSSWVKSEGNLNVARMHDEKKFHYIELYQYNGSELHALISQGVLQYSKSMKGICYSEVRISYFMGKELEGVNILSHKLGWLFYFPKGSSSLKSCDDAISSGKEVSVVGDVSFDDVIYVFQNIHQIGKKVSSKEINCEKKEIVSIFANKLNVLEVTMSDPKGNNFSLVLLKDGRKIKPDECYEIYEENRGQRRDR